MDEYGMAEEWVVVFEDGTATCIEVDVDADLQQAVSELADEEGLEVVDYYLARTLPDEREEPT